MTAEESVPRESGVRGREGLATTARMAPWLAGLAVVAFHSVLARFLDPQASIDASYYRILAERWLDGCGLTEPFIWQRITRHDAIVHPIDYWQPLGVFWTAAGVWIERSTGGWFRDTTLSHLAWGWLASCVWRICEREAAAATSPAASASPGLDASAHGNAIEGGSESSIPAAAGCRRPGRVPCWLGPLAASVLFGLGGKYAFYLGTTDNVALYAVLGFVLIEAALCRPVGGASGLLVGVAGGMMALTRVEGGIIWGLVVVALAREGGRGRGRALGFALIGFILIMMPWLLRNHLVLGRVWPDHRAALFLRHYNDMFDEDRLGAATLLADGVGVVVTAKLNALRRLGIDFLIVPSMIAFALFMVVGLAVGLRSGLSSARGGQVACAGDFAAFEAPVMAFGTRREGLVAVLLLALWLVCGLIFSSQAIRGTALHAIAAFLPHLAIGCWRGIPSVTGAWEHWRRLHPGTMTAGVLWLVIGWSVVFTVGATLASAENYAAEGGRYRRVLGVLAGARPDSVALSHEPIIVYRWTRMHGVVLPVASPSRALPLAERFNADYIIWDARLVRGVATESFRPGFDAVTCEDGLWVFVRQRKAAPSESLPAGGGGGGDE